MSWQNFKDDVYTHRNTIQYRLGCVAVGLTPIAILGFACWLHDTLFTCAMVGLALLIALGIIIAAPPLPPFRVGLRWRYKLYLTLAGTQELIAWRFDNIRGESMLLKQWSKEKYFEFVFARLEDFVLVKLKFAQYIVPEESRDKLVVGEL